MTTQPMTTQPPTLPTPITTTTTMPPTTAEKDARAPAELCSFFGIENAADQACVFEEPEFIVTEMTLDTGATTHAADRLDFPEQEVKESTGSRAGQTFGCAGGKRLANEGEADDDDDDDDATNDCGERRESARRTARVREQTPQLLRHRE